MRPPASAAASLFGLDSRRLPWVWLFISLLPYLAVTCCTVNAVGVVGEVALGWKSGPPIDVWIDLGAPPVDHTFGPLHARQSRPLERLVLGNVELPLAINAYTGGIPDWPGRFVHAATGSVAMVRVLHLLLGGGILTAVFVFLHRHAGLAAAVAATTVLGTRWDFVFYRTVLGGTEVTLVAATLATVWALWLRRWRGHPNGLTMMAFATGVGLHAKLTFALFAVALVGTAFLLRRDRPPMGPPKRASRLGVAAGLTLPLIPLVIATAHQAKVPPPHLRSHDHFKLQWDRVTNALSGGHEPTRESLGNILAWLGDPLGFLGRAYSVESVPEPTWLLNGLGWSVVILGIIMVWRRPHATPRDALLRFTSVLLGLGVLGLLVVARDLHHLASMSAIAAIVVGLAADQLAGLRFPRRSVRRVLAALLLSSPWILTGSMQLAQTDDVIAQVATPTFRTDGQAALATLIASSSARVVWVADYESMGALELAIERHRSEASLPRPLEIRHVWGAASRRATDQPDGFQARLLRASVGDHLLLVNASAPMIYNLRSRGRSLERIATKNGIQLQVVGRLPRDEAVLYAVSATEAAQREASP